MERNDGQRGGRLVGRRAPRRQLLGYITAALTLVVVAAPAARAVDTDMTISTTAVNFGQVAIGATASRSVTLTNTGGDPFGPINIFGGAPPTAEFGASQNCQGNTLPAGGSCMVNYSFSPGSAGSFSDTSSFTISETANQADGEDFSVALTGTGCTPPCGEPSITSFTPTSGPGGTVVTITGTNLTVTTGVNFGGVAATTVVVVSDTQVRATVPKGARTGPIVLNSATGAGESDTVFTVEAIDHDTRLILDLRRHLIARGQLSSDLQDCQDGVAVQAQRKVRGRGWKNAGSGTTDSTGGFRIELRDREGRYRVTVAEHSIGDTDTCLADLSNREVHRH
ncbi:MAG: choice-of-anchor D domain-containing protein [Actinomycetota bacterium]